MRRKMFNTFASALLLAVGATGCTEEEIVVVEVDDQARAAERNAEDAWDRAWSRLGEGGREMAEAGEYSLERMEEGAIRAYHKTQQVAGEAGGAFVDTAILASVKTRLLFDEDTRGMSINVDVDERTVTLTGQVASAEEASEATRIAMGTSGVDEVVSRLTWRPQPGPK